MSEWQPIETPASQQELAKVIEDAVREGIGIAKTMPDGTIQRVSPGDWRIPPPSQPSAEVG